MSRVPTDEEVQHHTALCPKTSAHGKKGSCKVCEMCRKCPVPDWCSGGNHIGTPKNKNRQEDASTATVPKRMRTAKEKSTQSLEVLAREEATLDAIIEREERDDAARVVRYVHILLVGQYGSMHGEDNVGYSFLVC